MNNFFANRKIYTTEGVFYEHPDLESDVQYYDECGNSVDIIVPQLYWHRLDGPAVIEYYHGNKSYQYWLDDASIGEKDWLKDPRVQEHLKNKAFDETIQEILSE